MSITYNDFKARVDEMFKDCQQVSGNDVAERAANRANNYAHLIGKLQACVGMVMDGQDEVLKERIMHSLNTLWNPER